MYKKHIKQITGFAGLGLATGLGSQIISKAGGDAGGLNAFSSFLPVGGTILGTSMTLDYLGDLNKKIKRR